MSAACPVCGKGLWGDEYVGQVVTHLACVEKQARALETSASLESDYSELQAELDGLGLSTNSRLRLMDWVGATAHRSGPGCPVDRRPAL